mmetsp:Transcript_9515/g.21823  ORF Transcript_9515/g.21823 Transcript_9515/m.21823 type:complete len:509 (-) Transcript_9515:2161-3687(-)
MLDLSNVGPVDELLELGGAAGLGVAHDERGVDALLLHLLARHLEILDQGIVAVMSLGRGDDLSEVRGVVGLDVGINCLGDHVGVELSGGEGSPDIGDVDGLRVLLTAGHVAQVLQEHGDGVHLLVGLLVDHEGLLEQLVGDANAGDVRAVEVVQTVDVLHHAGLVGLDGSQDQQVLQVLVVAELGALEHNLLQELNQLVGQVGVHERLDSHGHFLSILARGQGSGHHLVDQLALELVVVSEHGGPQIEVLTLDQIASLGLEEAVLVGDSNELGVALAALVGDDSEMRVALLAVLTHNAGIVEAVALQELLGFARGVDVDFGEGVVEPWLLVVLVVASLQPGEEHLEAVAGLAHLDELVDGAQVADLHDHGLDSVLGTASVQQRADNLGGAGGVDLLHVHLNVPHHVVTVQVHGQLFDKIVAIAHVDERPRVGQLERLQEVLGLLRRVVLGLASDALDLLEVVLHLADLAGRRDVLVVHVGVLAEVDDGTKEVVQTLHALGLLEQLNQS